jgi:myosin heavy subunit
MSKSNSSSKQSTIVWLIVGMVVLAAAAGYLWFDRSQLAEANMQQQAEIEEVEKIQAELEIQYEEAMTSLDEMKTDNIQLNALIDEQKTELADQKKKINNLLWTQKNLKEAKDEIANLTNLTKQYVAEIQSLKDENVQLNAKNVRLEEDKTMLIDNLTLEKENNTELQTAKAKLMSEKEELEEVKSELEAKVNVASVINVDNVVAQGLKMKDNGKEVARKAAKQIDKMRVCFDTEANLVAESGQEIFYIRIIDPQGETMAIESAGSGVLTNDSNGQAIRFSKKGVLNYQNKEVTACVDWAPGQAFPKGNYELEVYNKGYLAGKGSIQLK